MPGTALPFVVTRAWKVGTGYGERGDPLLRTHRIAWCTAGVRRSAACSVRWISPSRRDTIADARVRRDRDLRRPRSSSTTRSSARSRCRSWSSSAPRSSPRRIEDGLKRSDAIWVGVEAGGRRKPIPSWFVYRNGKDPRAVPAGARARRIETGAGHPGRIRARGRDAAQAAARPRASEFHAAARACCRVPEWEEAAKLLVDKRKSRVGAPSEWLARWRRLVRHRRAHARSCPG